MDEPEARMWDEGSYEPGSCDTYFEPAFASSEHLDRAPLLSEETYTAVSTVDPGDEHDDHCHWKARDAPPSAVPQLIAALVLCFFFMICELIGGYIAGSVSVMSDAAHMLSDCGGFALALLAFRCAERKPDHRMTYGHKRAEVLGAMVSVLLIWALTAIFVYVAASRLYYGAMDIQPDIMMIVSGAGVFFNIVLAMVLHGCAQDIAHHHTHGGAACSHAHAHTHTKAPSRFRLFRRGEANGAPNGDLTLNGDLALNGDLTLNGDLGLKELGGDAPVQTNRARNINLRAALIHVIGDLIQSCGVLLASVLIKFYPSAQMVDPLCSFVFSVLVLLTSARVVRDALNMLMQGVPTTFRYREMVRSLHGVLGVRHVHSAHVWALSTHHLVMTAHVAIDELSDPTVVLRACQQIARQYSVQSATIQVERYHPLMRTCDSCQQPNGEGM